MRYLQPKLPEADSTAGTVYDLGRARRWRLQRAAQGILNDKYEREREDGFTVPAFRYRVAMCYRGTNDADCVPVKRSADRLHARYGNLQTCGSPWHCPICAPKIAAERATEMDQAIKAWKKRKGECYFVTRTLQHTAERFGMGGLEDQLRELSAALSAAKGTRAFRDSMEAAGIVGTIRALEPMYGEINGWHAHTHEIMFGDAGQLATLRSVRKITPKKRSAARCRELKISRAKSGRMSATTSIRGQWARQLLKRGLAGIQPGDIGIEKFRKLRALLKRCITVQNGDYAADYAATFGREPEKDRSKWSLGREMTHSHMKAGRGGGVAAGNPARCSHASPWALLNDAMDGDKRSEQLFREYAIAFNGSRQIYWSPGLREMFFGMAERTNEAIAADDDKKCDELVMILSGSQWSLILSRNARFEFLRAAAERGEQGAADFLANLSQAPPTHSGEYVDTFNPILWRAAA